MNDSSSEIKYIVDRFAKNGLHIDDDQSEQLFQYYSMIVEKNKMVNLTAITEFKEVVDKHFIDSAILIKYIDLKGKSVIDVGTGAGFPGIPLKILCPEMKLTLLDSLRKRIDFLNEVMDELNLKNIEAIHSRAEELANKSEYRESYDVVVSRAVSNLSTLSEYCLPFLSINGRFFSYKSAKASQEISEAKNAIALLGGKIVNDHIVTLEGTDYDRVLIEIQKISNTPKKYPRTGNKPSSNPIR